MFYSDTWPILIDDIISIVIASLEVRARATPHCVAFAPEGTVRLTSNQSNALSCIHMDACAPTGRRIDRRRMPRRPPGRRPEPRQRTTTRTTGVDDGGGGAPRGDRDGSADARSASKDDDENDDENDENDDENDENDGFRLQKAPPLTKDMIDALDAIESRRVAARWSARMRCLKRRVEDCARQFPTSSLVFVFTKPFRSANNQRKWCVKVLARSRRDARPDGI